MNRRGSAWMLVLPAVSAALGGCGAPVRAPSPGGLDAALSRASHHAGPTEESPSPPLSLLNAALPANSTVEPPAGPQPVDVYIQVALAENRTVRAAWLNVESLRHRIPQVTSLDDPVVSNTVFPIPSVAPQYSLMGYMPYGALIAQQFPWCGTLRLRGEAAEHDVQVALQELAAAQLDVVAAVKKAYHDLAFAQRASEILAENRRLAVEFVKIAREKYRTGTATQADVLRSESAVSDIDREAELNLQNLADARSDLARLLHADPEADLQAVATRPPADVPGEVRRLYALAVASRPELRGRLAAVARDLTGVELARKRSYPNVTLGLVYQDMERTNAESRTAGGMPNVGLFVGFNLPVYRKKIVAGVREAEARAAADSALYEAESDQARRDVKDAFTQVRTQRNILELLRTSNLPRSRQIFEAATADYRAGNAGADYLSLLSAWRDVLQTELQIAQVETELSKALAGLERAVGVELNEHPPEPSADPANATRSAVDENPGPSRDDGR
ncbi:MAG: TolC family protein [Isosphaeraceae bacterium]